MPVLTKEEVQSWDRPKVDKALRAIQDDVASLREDNDGSLVGISGDKADTVRDHMQSLNALGERRDELVSQEKADGAFTRLSEYLDEPDPAKGHPGHTTNGSRAALEQVRDIGGLFIRSEAFKAFAEEGKKDINASFPLNSVIDGYQGIGEMGGLREQATLFDSTGFPVQPDYRPTPLPTLFQMNNVAPLMPQGTTNAATVRYPKELVTSQGADATDEGATKPEAQVSFSNVDELVRKIAVVLPLTDEIQEDVDFLRSYINARLQLFVQNKEDAEILGGSGTAPHLRGILNRSGIDTTTSYSIGGSTPDQALIDAVFHAAMRVRDSFLEPDAVVLKNSVWEIAALAKDGNRNYVLGGPGSVGYALAGMTPRLWGLRVVLNANMPAQVATNKVGLVGAFQTAAMVIRRSGIDLSISDSHSTFFYENKIALRAEERLALAVFRPAGFATITSAA